MYQLDFPFSSSKFIIHSFVGSDRQCGQKVCLKRFNKVMNTELMDFYW